jgi:hypothetical protein
VESFRQLELADIGAVRIERLGLKDMPGSLNFDLLRRVFWSTRRRRENKRDVPATKTVTSRRLLELRHRGTTLPRCLFIFID